MYQLEDRILFDAALVADVTDAQSEQNDQEQLQQDQQQAQDAAQGTTQNNIQELPPMIPADHASVAADAGTDASSALFESVLEPATDSETPAVNVLVVSEKLANVDELLKSIGDDTLVVKYNPDAVNGSQLLDLIQDALGDRKADSIGFLSDASKDGSVKLISDGVTSMDSLSSDAQQNFWQGVDGLLSDNGRIDLFASDLASTDNGKALVDSISSLTDHRVAASTDITGDVDAGGDWELEYVSNSEHAMDVIDEYFDVASLDTFDHTVKDPVEVVFINSSVKDADSIIANLGRDVEVVYLSDDGGFEQITDYLNGRADIDAIHIFTHGDKGSFIIGKDVVNDNYVNNHSDLFASLGGSMAKDGDIMLYGCSVAGDEAGQAFIQNIADATGVDVAASSDRTGFTGDWDLEFRVGDIQTAAFVISDYQYILRTAGTLTVRNMADRALEGNYLGINEDYLTLREALAISVDGDTIVFDEYSVLGKQNIYYLVDTLSISTAVTINGIIAKEGGSTSVTIMNNASFNGQNYRENGTSARLLYIDVDSSPNTETTVAEGKWSDSQPRLCPVLSPVL